MTFFDLFPKLLEKKRSRTSSFRHDNIVGMAQKLRVKKFWFCKRDCLTTLTTLTNPVEKKKRTRSLESNVKRVGHSKLRASKSKRKTEVIPGSSVPKDLVNIDVSGSRYCIELTTLNRYLGLYWLNLFLT